MKIKITKRFAQPVGRCLLLFSSAVSALSQAFELVAPRVTVTHQSSGGGYELTSSITPASGATSSAAYTLLAGFRNDAGEAVPIPTLSVSINAASRRISISWTPDTSGFVLQESLDLTAAQWVNSPIFSSNPVSLPIADTRKFFRLVKPN